MTEKPTALLNATWLSPEGVFREGAILIKNNRMYHQNIRETPLWGMKTLDLRGFLIIPGIIDPHVHLREPGTFPCKEGIRNGTRAAIMGGVTTVLDMPNTVPPCDYNRQLEAKKSRFRKKSHANWGLHFLASEKNPASFPAWIASTKIYMAKSSLRKAITDEWELADIFSRSMRVAIHAEDETFFLSLFHRDVEVGRFRPDGEVFKDPSSKAPIQHHEARPRKAVVSALRKIERAYLSLSPEKRPRLILCHVSTKNEIEWVKKKKAAGWDLWAETCPHYLFFTCHDLETKGNWFKVNPPLRSESDRAAILEAVKDGTIDFIATDHAPHRPDEKTGPGTAPSGIASIEWLGPLLLTLVDDGEIGWRRFLELTVENSAKCYGIACRDGIKDGNFADFTVISPSGDFFSKPKIQTRTGFNPYSDFRFSREIKMVMVNGNPVFSDGEFKKQVAGMEVYGEH